MPSFTDPLTEYLLICLQPNSSLNTPVTPSNLSGWLALYQRAAAHQVSPLLYQRFKNAQSGICHNAFIQLCQQHYQQNAYQNVRFYQTIAEVSRAFHAANIPLILLKGSHLSKYIYQNLAIRHMADIDILIQPQDLDAVETILAEMGYTLQNPEAREWYYHYHYHLVYRSPQNIHIEIHWHIQEPKLVTIPIQACWAMAQLTTLDNIPVRLFCQEHLLLHLCAHLAQNSFQLNLKHLYDIAFILQHLEPAFSWSRFIETTLQWQLEKSVYLALHLAHHLLAAPIADIHLNALRPASITPAMITTAQQSLLNIGINPLQKAAKFYTEWRFSYPKQPAIVPTTRLQYPLFKRYHHQGQLIYQQTCQYIKLLLKNKKNYTDRKGYKKALYEFYQYARFNYWLKKRKLP